MHNSGDFLKELTELTHKYNIKIIGCGCCASPSLTSEDNGNGKYIVDDDDGNLEYKLTKKD